MKRTFFTDAMLRSRPSQRLLGFRPGRLFFLAGGLDRGLRLRVTFRAGAGAIAVFVAFVSAGSGGNVFGESGHPVEDHGDTPDDR